MEMTSTPKRIMIIGQPGSGKSTLAARLGDVTDLPVYHIDKEVHWLPNWVERDRADKARLCAEIHAKDEWIFEGGHSSTWQERLARADMLIWLDVPLWLRYWRVIKRRVQYNKQSRPDLPENCPERLNWEFTRWIWDTRKRFWNMSNNLFLNVPANKRKYKLATPNQVSAFVAQIKEEFASHKS